MFKTLITVCFSLLTVSAQAQDVLALLQAVEESSQTSEQDKQSNDRTFRRGGGRGNGGGHVPNRPPPQPRPGRPGYPQPPRPPSYPDYPGYPSYPSYPGYGVQCVVQDNGHEEHYRGHGSCGECLSLHGNCTETCSEQTSVCTAEGYDRYGNRINFEARGSDRYQAENEAYYRCQSRAGNCRITYCDERNEVVSRRYCR